MVFKIYQINLDNP